MFFRCFLGVFEPKTPILSYFEGGSKGVLAKKPDFWSIFGPKTTWSQIILGTIAKLLAVVWSMNDVCEAQKMCFLDTLNLKIDSNDYFLTARNNRLRRFWAFYRKCLCFVKFGVLW